MLILGIPNVTHARFLDASQLTANTDTLHLSQASTFGACEKDGITVIHALSRTHRRKAACRLPFLPRRERSRAV